MKIDYSGKFNKIKLDITNKLIKNDNIKKVRKRENNFIREHSSNNILDSNFICYEIKEFVKSDQLELTNIIKNHWSAMTTLVNDYHPHSNKLEYFQNSGRTVKEFLLA